MPAVAPAPPAPNPAPEPPRPAPPEDLPPAGAVPLEMEPGEALSSSSAQSATLPKSSTKARDDVSDFDDLLSMDSDPFEQPGSFDGASGDDDLLGGLTLDGGAIGGDDKDDFDSFGLGGGDDGQDLDDLLAGDPDPIPAMFSRDDDDTPRKGGRAGLWVLIAVIIMGALGGGAWMFRERLVQMVPALEDLYSLAGIDATPLGHGLIFRDVTSDLIDRGNGQMLVVRGFVENESDRDRPVPYIRLALYDRTGALLDQVVAQPPQGEMAGGETAGFRVQADNPSAATHRFTVDWIETPPNGG